MKFKKSKQHSGTVVVGSGKKSSKLFGNKKTTKAPLAPITKIENGIITGELKTGFIYSLKSSFVNLKSSKNKKYYYLVALILTALFVLFGFFIIKSINNSTDKSDTNNTKEVDKADHPDEVPPNTDMQEIQIFSVPPDDAPKPKDGIKPASSG